MRVQYILENYLPGDADVDSDDPWTWSQEFQQLWTTEHEYMAGLAVNIQQEGFKVPVLLGDDGRVWDGHHRLAVAWAFLYDEIPALSNTDPYWYPKGNS